MLKDLMRNASSDGWVHRQGMCDQDHIRATRKRDFHESWGKQSNTVTTTTHGIPCWNLCVTLRLLLGTVAMGRIALVPFFVGTIV